MRESARPPVGARGDFRLEALFLIAYGMTLAGVAMALVDATAITTNAAGGSDGGIYTSVYLAVLLVATAVSIPPAPALAARLGPTRTMALTSSAGVLLWLLIGVLTLVGFEPMQVLVIGAIGVGVLSGVFSALVPLFAKAYLAGGRSMAEANSRLSIPRGLSWAAGAAAGGVILHRVDPGWGLMARAVLGVPLVLVFVLRPPQVEPEAPAVSNGAWRDMLRLLRENLPLRRAVLLGCGVSMLAAPLVSMIVPIADALEHRPLIPGAATLMFTIAIGQMLAPAAVSVLERGRTNLRAAAVAGLATAAVIGIYGVSALALRGTPELVAWGAIGFAFGALNFSGNSLNLGAATDADDEENAATMVSVFVFTTTLAAPLGVLLWGLMMSRVSVEAAVLVGAAGTALVSLPFLRRRN